MPIYICCGRVYSKRRFNLAIDQLHNFSSALLYFELSVSAIRCAMLLSQLPSPAPAALSSPSTSVTRASLIALAILLYRFDGHLVNGAETRANNTMTAKAASALAPPGAAEVIHHHHHHHYDSVGCCPDGNDDGRSPPRLQAETGRAVPGPSNETGASQHLTLQISNTASDRGQSLSRPHRLLAHHTMNMNYKSKNTPVAIQFVVAHHHSTAHP